MNWLAQNWIWVVVGVAIAWFAFRGGAGGHARGHGGSGSGHGGHGGGLGGLLGGMGHGGHGGGHGGQQENRAGARAPEAAIDPVSGAAVRTADALTSLYQGKIYYFASRENRDRFEAAPQEFAQKATGHAAHPAEPVSEPRRKRRGC